MQQKKISLTCIDNNEALQDEITRRSMAFAEIFLWQARENRLTPEQVARDLETTTEAPKIIIS